LYTGGRAGEVENRKLKVERKKVNAVTPRLLRSSQKQAAELVAGQEVRR
jgi:hypothetical protein